MESIVTTSSANDLRATMAATRATWEANGMFFAAFEETGDSYRDFQIPLSSKLLNQTVSDQRHSVSSSWAI